jgi:hypothetical protein
MVNVGVIVMVLLIVLLCGAILWFITYALAASGLVGPVTPRWRRDLLEMALRELGGHPTWENVIETPWVVQGRVQGLAARWHTSPSYRARNGRRR